MSRVQDTISGQVGYPRAPGGDSRSRRIAALLNGRPLCDDGIVEVADAATITFDLSLGAIFRVTLGGNRTLAVSHAEIGVSFSVHLIQDGTGSRTVTWPTTTLFPGGTIPTLTTDADAIDVFALQVVDDDEFYGFVVGLDMS